MTESYRSRRGRLRQQTNPFRGTLNRSTATPSSDLAKSTTPFAWFVTPIRLSHSIVPYRLEGRIKNCYCHPFRPTTKSMHSFPDSRGKWKPSLLSGSQYIKTIHVIKGVGHIVYWTASLQPSTAITPTFQAASNELPRAKRHRTPRPGRKGKGDSSSS
jgi:hypothetical protein